MRTPLSGRYVGVLAIAILVAGFLLVACTQGASLPTATPGPVVQQLRIGNLSDQPIEGLVLLFPATRAGMLATRIEFGTIPPGELSEYLEVPSGVYRYAAYEYLVDGEVQHQPVTDWIGEEPMAGRRFTYELSFDPNGPRFDQIRLVSVKVDDE